MFVLPETQVLSDNRVVGLSDISDSLIVIITDMVWIKHSMFNGCSDLSPSCSLFLSLFLTPPFPLDLRSRSERRVKDNLEPNQCVTDPDPRRRQFTSPTYLLNIVRKTEILVCDTQWFLRRKTVSLSDSIKKGKDAKFAGKRKVNIRLHTLKLVLF